MIPFCPAEHAAILGVFLAIGVTGFGAEMFRIAEATAAGEDMSWEEWSFVGYPLSTLVDRRFLTRSRNTFQRAS